MTTFPLPAGGGNVVELAAGPAGIWFTDPSANRVGEVDSSGHVVEYGAPTPSNVLEVDGMGLVVGPDGDAYYLEQDQASVIKVAPGGSIESFAIPNTTTLTNLLAGSDGVYFQGQVSGGSPDGDSYPLDRLAPDGTLTTVATDLPEGTGMAFGPDGNLWFAGLLSIGRVVLAPAPVPEPGPTLVIGGLPSFGGTATGPVAAVGEAASTELALTSHSADVTADSVMIDWGDGSAPTAGTLVPEPPLSDSGFGLPPAPFAEGLVSGSHAYSKAGSYTVTVTIRGTGPRGASLTASTVETVSAVDPSPSPQSLPGLEAGRSIAFQGPVLAFSTPTPHDGSGSDFTAKVDWGDGSGPTAGAVAGGQGPASSFIPFSGTPEDFFEVSGGHTYATAGSYTVDVTLTDSSGHVSTGSSPIRVAPRRLAFFPTSPIAATADPSPDPSAFGRDYIDLGTMADFLGGPTAAADSVMIDWGDGSAPTAGTLNPSSGGDGPPASGTSSYVGGMHAYAKAGDYTIKITAADQQGDSTEATATADISPRQLAVTPSNLVDPWAGSYSNITAISGVPIPGVSLFTISPPISTDPASDFMATIDWGDGSAATTGTVESAADAAGLAYSGTADGGLAVTGEHTYSRPGLYDVSVIVAGPGGSTAQATANASVALPVDPVLAPSTLPGFISGLASTPLPLASFSTQDTDVTAADFRATVDWGDGSPIQAATIEATIPPDAPSAFIEDAFNVIAGHDYAQAGNYQVTITVLGGDGIPNITPNQAIVSAPPPPVVVVAPGNPPAPIPTPPPLPAPPDAPPNPIPTPVPTPVLTPTPAPTPSPVLPTTGPQVVGPRHPLFLPSPFPRFAPTIAKHLRPIEHPKPARPTAHHAVTLPRKAKPKAAHHVAAKKPVHVAHPKKHPTGPAGHAKSHR